MPGSNPAFIITGFKALPALYSRDLLITLVQQLVSVYKARGRLGKITVRSDYIGQTMKPYIEQLSGVIPFHESIM